MRKRRGDDPRRTDGWTIGPASRRAGRASASALDPLRWAARRLYLGLRIVWQAIMHLIDDGGMTFAGHIAFMTLFSLFPFLIFLTTLAGEFGQTEAARDFITMALGSLPAEVGDAIRPAIDQVINNRRTGLMTVSIVASLWATSSGIEALREALNKAYGVEEPRSIWFCRLQSLLFTIVASIGIIIVMLVLVIGPVVWSYVAAAPPRALAVGLVLRDRCATSWRSALLYLVVALLYRWLPSRHLPRREILPGAAVTVVLWLVLASLFSLYLQNLGRFSVTYGSLGGIVITLMFFYISRPDLHLRRRDQQRTAARRGRAAARGARRSRHEAAAG